MSETEMEVEIPDLNDSIEAANMTIEVQDAKIDNLEDQVYDLEMEIDSMESHIESVEAEYQELLAAAIAVDNDIEMLDDVSLSLTQEEYIKKAKEVIDRFREAL